MKKKIIPFLVLVTIASVGILSCSKNNSDDSHVLNVRLTDNPYNAEEVNVDIKEVKVRYDEDSTSTDGWQTLNTNARIYDLLSYQNGKDTLIATGRVPASRVREIRLVLGSANTIKIDGQTYDMTVPSGAESGLKLKIDKELSGNEDSLIIDFDADLSVHQTGNGKYMLRPVIRLKD